MTEQADNNSFKEQSLTPDLVEKYMEDMIKLYKTSQNYISPKFTEKSIKREDSTLQCSEDGFLQVEVTSGKGTVPIENAKITVVPDGECAKLPLESLTTNKNGETVVVPLSTNSKGFQVTRNGKAYSTYNIVVSADGFYPSEKLHVPVFPNIKLIQAVDLIPMIEF